MSNTKSTSAVYLVILVLAVGCTGISLVSGPTVLQLGDTASYVLSLSGNVDGSNLMFYVVAEVPIGWALSGNSFSGTASGAPISGSATVVAEPTPGCVPGPRDGFQLIWLEAGPFTTLSSDTAEATLEFSVDSLPAGEFAIRFWFVTSSWSDTCGKRPAELVVNQGSRLFRFVETLTNTADMVLDQNISCVLTSSGKNACFAGGGTAEELAAFSRNPVSGSLAHLTSHSDPLFYRAIAISPDDLHLYTVAWQHLQVLRHDPVGGTISVLQTLEDGVGGVSGLNDVQGVVVSPDGEHVYSAADGAVGVFDRNPTTGELVFVTALFDGVGGVDGIAGAVSIAASADGNSLYVGGNTAGKVAVFDRDQQTGLLSFVETHWVFISSSRGLAVSPDGLHVYVTEGDGDSIVIFGRDGSTGELTYLNEVSDGQGDVFGMWIPTHLSLSPGGKYLAVTARSDSLVVFQRDASGGGLSFLHADVNLGMSDTTHAHVAFSPDGGDLFLLDGGPKVLVFSPRIFGDGFESGDPTAWSSVAP